MIGPAAEEASAVEPPVIACGIVRHSPVPPGVSLALERHLRRLPGMIELRGDPYLRMIYWQADQNELDREGVETEIVQFTAAPLAKLDEASRSGYRPAMAAFAAAMLIYGLLWAVSPKSPSAVLYGAGILAALAVLGLGHPLFRRAWASLQRRIIHEDTLWSCALLLCLAATPLAVRAALPLSWLGAGPLLLSIYLALCAHAARSSDHLLHGLQAAGRAPEDLLRKLAIQELPDQAASVIPPVALALSIGAFLLWWLFAPAEGLTAAWRAAVSVLVLGSGGPALLSLPAAAGWGTVAGARRGIRWRDAGILEHVWQVGIAAFAKSGVLTEGAPRVTAVYPAPGWLQEAVVRIAAAVEKDAEHPVAQAIRDEAARLHLDLPEAGAEIVVSNRGVTGWVEGRLVRAGTRAFMDAHSVDCSAIDDADGRTQTEGKTSIIVSSGQRAAGCIAVVDRLRRDSVQTMRLLGRLGLRVVLVTGDSAGTAQTVAEQLGIKETYGDADRARREQVLQRLSGKTIGKVAFVQRPAGGIVSPLPVLLQTELPPGNGLALSGAELLNVPSAFQLARSVRSRALQGQITSAFALVVLVPAGALSLLPPAIAALAILLLQSIVLWNGKRILRFDPAAAAKTLLRKREMLERL